MTHPAPPTSRPLPRRALLGAAFGGTLASCTPPPSPPAGSGARVALVVGNARYQRLPALRNTINDANLVARAAQAAGFTLYRDRPEWDFAGGQLAAAIGSLAEAARGGGSLLVYFAGHGVQLHHENWLAPVDAIAGREADIHVSMVAVARLLDVIAQADLRAGVLLLDACRENPFLAPGIAGLEQGFAQVRPPPRVAVGFSTQPGAVAQDGLGSNGPYALAIAQALGANPVIADMLASVSDGVWRVTGGQQRPWSALGADMDALTLTGA